MKAKLFKVISLILMLILLVFSASAQDYQKQLIGEITSKVENVDGLIVYFSATAERVDINYINLSFLKNKGIKGQYIIRAGKAESFEIKDIAPLSSGKISMDNRMIKSDESIAIIIDGRNRVVGRRLVPLELMSVWNRGTFDTVYDSLNYHFAKHGAEVDAGNIVDYMQKSKLYRDEIELDTEKLSEKQLNNIYRITKSTGKSQAHKYKHRDNQQFAILLDEGLLILSYGK